MAVISNGFREVTSIKSHLLPQLHPRSSGEVQYIKASDNSREKRELDRDKGEKKGREQEDWRDKNVKGKAKDLRNTIWWTQPELRPKPNSGKVELKQNLKNSALHATSFPPTRNLQKEIFCSSLLFESFQRKSESCENFLRPM